MQQSIGFKRFAFNHIWTTALAFGILVSSLSVITTLSLMGDLPGMNHSAAVRATDTRAAISYDYVLQDLNVQPASVSQVASDATVNYDYVLQGLNTQPASGSQAARAASISYDYVLEDLNVRPVSATSNVIANGLIDPNMLPRTVQATWTLGADLTPVYGS